MPYFWANQGVGSLKEFKCCDSNTRSAAPGGRQVTCLTSHLPNKALAERDGALPIGPTREKSASPTLRPGCCLQANRANRRGRSPSGGGLLPIGLKPRVDQGDGCINDGVAQALLRRDGLHQLVRAFDVG